MTIPAVELPASDGTVRCVTLSNGDADDVWVTTQEHLVQVEYTRRDPSSGRFCTYRVRQFDRDDPDLRSELARLRPAPRSTA